MPPRPHPNDEDALIRFKAAEYDRRNLETQDILVAKVQRLENELAVFKAKLAVITVLGSTAATVLLHLLAKYFKFT